MTTENDKVEILKQKCYSVLEIINDILIGVHESSQDEYVDMNDLMNAALLIEDIAISLKRNYNNKSSLDCFF